ncbi:MAG: nucleotidyltransferase domain-containing protein [Nanoarchaeota archaeon]|nr:nucleotidyltransferase domain-containing protein [Nanoarchaeota archaeon]MBU4116962.1 nucleotidyltransferase domain-containing protein [Nanoarchaeota archaeon]
MQIIKITYIYCFVNFIFEKIKEEEIEEIILFGSFVSGMQDKESDIDLFIVPSNKQEKNIKKLEIKIKNILNEFELRQEEKPSFSIFVDDMGKNKYKELKKEIEGNHLVLYGKKSFIDKKKNYCLIKYKSGKNLKIKMKLTRKLFGYEMKKAKKTYKQKGIVETFGGEKFAENTIKIPLNHRDRILSVLKEFKVSYQIFDVCFFE